MVTNINLIAPDAEKKSRITGKSSLIIAISLLLAVLIIFGFLIFLETRYNKENEVIKAAIKEKNEGLADSSFSTIVDFQERLNLLDNIVSDHVDWSEFLLNFSQYVLPEVKINRISNRESKNIFSMRGNAPNYDTVAREIVLIKEFPGAESVELKNTVKKTSEGGQSSIDFEVNLKIRERFFGENNSPNL